MAARPTSRPGSATPTSTPTGSASAPTSSAVQPLQPPAFSLSGIPHAFRTRLPRPSSPPPSPSSSNAADSFSINKSARTNTTFHNPLSKKPKELTPYYHTTCACPSPHCALAGRQPAHGGLMRRNNPTRTPQSHIGNLPRARSTSQFHEHLGLTMSTLGIEPQFLSQIMSTLGIKPQKFSQHPASQASKPGREATSLQAFQGVARLLRIFREKHAFSQRTTGSSLTPPKTPFPIIPSHLLG